MRRLRRIMTGAAIVSLMGLMSPPVAEAVAYPRPLADEWWFIAWAVNNKIWPITQGEGVTVAVLDSGVQASIPDLSGAVLTGTDATNGGGDGRTDTESPGHGTAMATTIAGRGTSTGFLGVAPKAKILPVVAKSHSGIVKGIRYATDRGVKIISISQGISGPCPDDMQEAVSYAVRHDVIISAGAGDSGNSSNESASPANCAGVLGVGAVDNHLKAWSKTERQPYVAIAAPGVDVPGVLANGQLFKSEGGTSQATALTSGGIALLRSKFPDESRTDILKRVFASLRDAGTPGKDEQTGYGVFRPVQVLSGGVPNSPAYEKWASSNGKLPVDPGKPTAKPQAGTSKGSSVVNAIKFFGIPILAAIVILIIALVARSRQSKKVARAGGPRRQPPPGQAQQGPPPSFGPQQGPGAPPEGRPPFGPPNQGPPPGRR